MKRISKFAMKLSADASRFGMTISILLYGLAASTSGQTPTVHPIPSAPKNHYSEASVYALPQLQCKLHPTGDRTTKPLNVFTDDDGYAAFTRCKRPPLMQFTTTLSTAKTPPASLIIILSICCLRRRLLRTRSISQRSAVRIVRH